MYRIVLVVDEHFGQRLLKLARTAYVWIVQSTDNDLWAKNAWESCPDSEDPLLHGVSSFGRQQNESTESLIVRVLDMIDEHHGEFAHDPEWSEIDVVGGELTTAIMEAARTYGVTECNATQVGFQLMRSDSG